ncbi:unnamed protein product [Peniophora sp. CBMAI 1063]|nr:unnamed protein product [Peniophora sp. CBMAI 1063]
MASRWNRPLRRESANEPAVTIGLRIQYTGIKALHYPRALPGTPELVPKSLLQDVRQDLRASGLGSALPNNDNAHFSALMKNTVEIFWPHLSAHQAKSLKVHLWTRFEKITVDMLASRSVSCMMFYILPGSLDSLHTHPPEEDLQGFVCDPGTVDKTFASTCRGAMALIRHAQEQDMLSTLRASTDDKPTAFSATEHRGRSPARPDRGTSARSSTSRDPMQLRERRRSSSPPSNTWRPPNRLPPTGPRADRLRQVRSPPRANAPPSPARKRSPDPAYGDRAEEEIRELRAKVRRLEDSRDAAQTRARELRREVDAIQAYERSAPSLSEMKDEILKLKARTRRVEDRELQLHRWLKDMLGEEWHAERDADLDDALALLKTKLTNLRVKAEQSEAELARLEQYKTRERDLHHVDAEAMVVPALLEALMQIADSTGGAPISLGVSSAKPVAYEDPNW